MRNSKLTALVCSLVAILATVIFYIFAFDTIFRIPMRWISLVFLLITECIGTIKSLLIRKSIISYASIFSSAIHLGLVVVLSLIFVNIFPLLIKTYILLNILLICALAIVDLFLSHFGKTLSASNDSLKKSQAVMDTCYIKAQELVILFESSPYKKDLEEIVELIKYSDNSALTDDEAIILSKLEELSIALTNGDEKASSLIAEIKSTIKIRTIKIKSIKRGGF